MGENDYEIILVELRELYKQRSVIDNKINEKNDKLSEIELDNELKKEV